MKRTAAKDPLVVPRSWVWVGGMGLLYLVLQYGSLHLSVQRNGLAIFSFAHSLGSVALLALPRRQWPRMLGVLGLAAWVAFAGHAWQSGQAWLGIGGAAVGGAPWLHSLGLTLISLVEITLGAVLLRHWGSIHPDDFHAPQRLGRLLSLGAVLPVSVSALLAALLPMQAHWPLFAETAVSWLAGHLIGTVATLPLALTLWMRGPQTLGAELRRPLALPLVLLSVGVTLAGAATLPHPFVVMIIPMVLLALNAGFAMTALANFIAALLVVGLISSGVLLAPPSAVWWGDVLYYGAVLAALIPGLFLASSVEGRAAVLRQISANEQRYRKLYEATPAMMHSADASQSMGGPILSVSERWLQVTGYQRDEVVGHRFVEFLTPESIRFAYDVAIPQVLANGHCEDFEGQIITRDGRTLDVLFSAVLERDANGEPVRTYAVMQDITEKKRLAEKSHFAEHDALTGLPNRVLLNDRLERVCAQHERYGGKFAVGFLDLDHFKEINDRHGHEAGDELLREVARRLVGALRATDTVCRLGGDEFVLLISATESADLLALASKVLQQVAQPVLVGKASTRGEVAVSASLGLAIYPQHGRNPQALLQHADEAMYQSKRSGRNRCMVYSQRESGQVEP